MRLTIRSPSTGDVLGSVPILDAAAVNQLVERARDAQPAWHALGVRARSDLLLKLRAVLAERADEVARMSCAETGKMPVEALLTDVQVTCDLARWYARRAPSILARKKISAGWLVTKRAYELREPYGVVGVIGPWNFPVLNCMRSVLSALVCGNTVILKPSEASPLCALLMREVATEAGFPDDVFLVATGDGATGAALVAADIDKLCFTGSVETGRRIAMTAAARLLPLSLELGGKDAMIVLAGADVERASSAAVAGAFLNAGQICTSIERVYVEAGVYDEFLKRVVDKAKQVTTGAFDSDADVGAITVEMQIEKIESQVRDAVRDGARVLTGGGRVGNGGRFYAPTVLTDVTQDMRVMREETFGPVLPIMKVKNAEEALKLANDSPFALGGAIWGQKRRAEKLVPELRAGMVSVNDTLLNGMIAGLPFGGLKESGYGRVYGDDALREMSWPRGVTVDRAGMREIAYYPLNRFGAKRALGLVQLISGSGIRTKLRGLMKLLFALPLIFAIVAGAEAQSRQKPDIVVFIAVDQLRPDYLDRFASQLTGGLKRLSTEGAFLTNAFQDHAVTETAPGHSTMLSGRFPRNTGIVSNGYGVIDPQSPLIVGTGAAASPFRFRGGGLMDWMRTNDPLSRGLSISRKDRAAILPMGRAKQQVFWYSPTGEFTTSRYYADTLPSWMKSFNARKLAQAYAGHDWDLLLDRSDYAEPDTVPIENNGRSTFPHRLSASGDSAAAALASYPWMDELTLRAALTGVDSLRLGKNDHTDLLAISLSTTDAVGHAYGPESREIHDQVLRLDRFLGAFMDSMAVRFDPGHIVYALTADHGVTPFPQLHGITTGQSFIDSRPVMAEVQDFLKAHNLTATAADFESGMLILNRSIFNDNQPLMDSVATVFARSIKKLPHVMRVDFVKDITVARAARNPVLRRWSNMIPRDLAIPVVVTLEPLYNWSAPTYAIHGMPTEADSHVPILFYGAQIKRGRYNFFARTVDIGPTLAALLSIRPTEVIDGQALTQVFK